MFQQLWTEAPGIARMKSKLKPQNVTNCKCQMQTTDGFCFSCYMHCGS